ncbi:unnamed protein product, partial [Ilex paraguariensis]
LSICREEGGVLLEKDVGIDHWSLVTTVADRRCWWCWSHRRWQNVGGLVNLVVTGGLGGSDGGVGAVGGGGTVLVWCNFFHEGKIRWR